MKVTIDKILLNAITLHKEKKFDKAERLYRKILETHPNLSEIHNNLGITLQKLDRLDEAELTFKRAIELNPNYAENYYNLGIVQIKLNKLNEAEVNYKKAIELRNDFAEARNNLGSILQKLNRFDEAEECYKKAIEISPDFVEVHNDLGNTLQKLNRFDEAEVCYKKAIELKPDFAEAHNNMGIVLMELGRLEESEISYKKSITLKPDYYEALFNLSITQGFLNKLELSIFQLEHVLKISDDNFKFLAAVNLSIFKFLEDDIKESKKYIFLASEIQENIFFDVSINTYKAYYNYLIKLLDYYDSPYLKKDYPIIDKKLYVIGDSHTLVSHGLRVKKLGSHFLCKSKLIMGCKQWHLANTNKNKYKFKFENIICSLPKFSEVLLSIGEIDCRLDDGIIKYNKNYLKKNRKDLIIITVESYLNFIYKINLSNQHKINIQGVPCPNIETKNISKETTSDLIELIREFNILLKKKSTEKGFGFLDLHKLTDRGDGFSNKVWHLDNHHLLPNGIEEAWRSYYVKI